MSERERMVRGEPYDSRDSSLLATAHRARALLAAFSATPSTNVAERRRLLEQLLGGVGEDVWIEPPFACDYGENLYIGANSFVNFNCVFLDSAEIRIGANALIGPGVQLLTATHPLRAADRVIPPDQRGPNGTPYRLHARPVRLGDNVWIGAGAIVLPGVTIGDNVTIGAGSIVTSDIPGNVLAFGNPCRVQRSL
ncbi:MAG TPA: sugar O-acetyltransferase [Gemmatimonadaceae bacterium]|nr:sugar O-acetyltransferase [Gemmatimonadaceae bacterium]